MESETSEKSEVKRKVSFDTPAEHNWRRQSKTYEVEFSLYKNFSRFGFKFS